MTAGLTDTHCHLIMGEFTDDLPQVLERAAEAGVATVVVPGIDLQTSRAAVSLAESHPGLHAAVGIHPHHADTWNSSVAEEILALAGSEKVVAIGEIGLDFYRDFSPRRQQRLAFREQLAMARRLGLPVIVHNRKAIEDVLQELDRWATNLPASLKDRSGVMHAFSADRVSATRALEMGMYLGVAGPVTFRNAADLRTVVGSLPIDRLLVETDAPYLTPHPHRGSRNEPAYVRLVAEGLAGALETEVARVTYATSENANRLFEWEHGTNNGHIL